MQQPENVQLAKQPSWEAQTAQRWNWESYGSIHSDGQEPYPCWWPFMHSVIFSCPIPLRFPNLMEPHSWKQPRAPVLDQPWSSQASPHCFHSLHSLAVPCRRLHRPEVLEFRWSCFGCSAGLLGCWASLWWPGWSRLLHLWQAGSMHHRTESLHSYFASDPPSCGIKINENESVCPMVTPTADPQSPKSLYHWWITQNETGLLWRRNWAMLVWNRLEFIKPGKSTLQKFLAAEEIQAKPLQSTTCSAELW